MEFGAAVELGLKLVVAAAGRKSWLVELAPAARQPTRAAKPRALPEPTPVAFAARSTRSGKPDIAFAVRPTSHHIRYAGRNPDRQI